MAKLSSLFDANKVAPQAPRSIIPKGKYPVMIEKSEMKPTKSGNKTGAYLELILRVIDGEYKGAVLYDRLNLKNDNAQAVAIAQATLSAICHATGVMKVSDSVELHNKPMLASVVVEEAVMDPKNATKVLYDEKNEIKGYEPLEGSVATATAAAPATAPKWGAKSAAPAAAPAETPAPAAPAVKKGAPAAPKPAAPAPAPEPTPEIPATGVYYVQQEDGSTTEASAAEIVEMLAAGMPADNPICKEGDEEWKTAEGYGIGAAPAVAKKPTPWLKNKK